MAALEDDSVAQVEFGICLEHGLGVERDEQSSFRLYETASCNNNVVAAGYCALSLHFGIGVCEDVESAADYYNIHLNSPSFVTDNCPRCSRGLNRRPVLKPHLENQHLPTDTDDIHSSRASRASQDRRRGAKNAQRYDFGGFRIPVSIQEFRVEPMTSTRGGSVGRGSFGNVAVATDPKNHEKRIAVKRSIKASDRAVFIREITILAKLKHPRVIEMRGWWMDHESRTIGILMQYAQNGDLSRHLGIRGRPPPHEFCGATRQATIICDILLGMRYIHSLNVIHRDLKPANIFVDENWRCLLGDFGLSRLDSAEGPPTRDAFTPCYAAPEMRTPGVTYDEKVDVFAFGLVVYEIIEGRAVFPHEPSDVLPNIPVHFGGLMQRLIPRCWCLDPIGRPSFGDIFTEFQRYGFAILPGADTTVISQAVSEVLALERANKALASGNASS
jgi:hypothetical protein